MKAEWIVGQLSISDIARAHGCKPSAIHKRAERHAWPSRESARDVVTAVVTKEAVCPSGVTNARIALTAFGRVLDLLHRHRRMAGRISSEIERCLADLEQWRATYDEPGEEGKVRRPGLEEIQAAIGIARQAALALKALVPIERQAFGIPADEVWSEADAMSDEDREAIMATIRRVTGEA